MPWAIPSPHRAGTLGGCAPFGSCSRLQRSSRSAAACCIPAPDGDSSGSSDLGPPGPAPWVATLAELTRHPKARPNRHSAGTRFHTYDYDIPEFAELNAPSLMVGRHGGEHRAIKWFMMSLGRELPAPGQFGPAGGVRLLASERVGTVDRDLYAIEAGPLAGWFLAVDRRDDGSISQIHVPNRPYLRVNMRRIAAAGGVR